MVCAPTPAPTTTSVWPASLKDGLTVNMLVTNSQWLFVSDGFFLLKMLFFMFSVKLHDFTAVSSDTNNITLSIKKQSCD